MVLESGMVLAVRLLFQKVSKRLRYEKPRKRLALGLILTLYKKSRFYHFITTEVIGIKSAMSMFQKYGKANLQKVKK